MENPGEEGGDQREWAGVKSCRGGDEYDGHASDLCPQMSTGNSLYCIQSIYTDTAFQCIFDVLFIVSYDQPLFLGDLLLE